MNMPGLEYQALTHSPGLPGPTYNGQALQLCLGTGHTTGEFGLRRVVGSPRILQAGLKEE